MIVSRTDAAPDFEYLLSTKTAAGIGTHTVVLYLYVHQPGERFNYPSSRASGSAANTAMRYLECALVQAASLRLRDVECDVALVTNLNDLYDSAAVEPRGVRLIQAMEDLGVRMLYADYEHRNRLPVESYASSRYLLDAIVTAVDGGEPDHMYWFTDIDCVWVDPRAMFENAPTDDEVGCLIIPYGPDWDIEGTTPRRLGEFGQELGACPTPIPWVGGELISGTAGALRRLVRECDALDDEVGERGAKEIPAEEHLLTLAGGLGRVPFKDLSTLGWRVLTGPRHHAHQHPDPGSLGIWHLPSEKGLGFRRTANALLGGRSLGVMRDFEDTRRAMKRFNVSGAGWQRRLRDDGWLTAHRLRRALAARA
jgi:hypothetical protein